MPVTKTAKRALRSSKKKAQVNKLIINNLNTAIRIAKRNKDRKSISKAISLVDRATKKKIMHKNKAARIKSRLSKYLPKSKSLPKKSKK